MKRFFSGLIAGVLILTFVTCVFCYGTDKRFSPEKYIENLSELKTTLFLTYITIIWSEDGYAIPDFTSDSIGIAYYNLDPYDGESDILQFFDSIRCFFMRCAHTGAWLAKMMLDFFSNYKNLLPWNATESRGGTGGRS